MLKANKKAIKRTDAKSNSQKTSLGILGGVIGLACLIGLVEYAAYRATPPKSSKSPVVSVVLYENGRALISEK